MPKENINEDIINTGHTYVTIEKPTAALSPITRESCGGSILFLKKLASLPVSPNPLALKYLTELSEGRIKALD